MLPSVEISFDQLSTEHNFLIERRKYGKSQTTKSNYGNASVIDKENNKSTRSHIAKVNAQIIEVKDSK